MSISGNDIIWPNANPVWEGKSAVRVNADFSERVVIDTEARDWAPSPTSGVERKMLDRIGDEVARATTIVRFAPGSTFPAHEHGGGEEFLVLEGVFSDEHGDFGVGSYQRNPVGTSHAPHTEDGCTILVKLWQFQDGDDTEVRLKTEDARFEPGPETGIEVLNLHQFGEEKVALIRMQAGARFGNHTHDGGEEIFVLEGALQDGQGDYPAGTWVRNPVGSGHDAYSETGCLIYRKTGHLTPDLATLSDPADRAA